MSPVDFDLLSRGEFGKYLFLHYNKNANVVNRRDVNKKAFVYPVNEMEERFSSCNFVPEYSRVVRILLTHILSRTLKKSVFANSRLSDYSGNRSIYFPYTLLYRCNPFPIISETERTGIPLSGTPPSRISRKTRNCSHRPECRKYLKLNQKITIKT